MLGISAGGSVPLVPTGIWPATKPLVAVREAVQVIRRMLAGETVDFQGEVIKCSKARVVGPPKQKIPIYIAGRRPMMLSLLGEIADGALIDVTPWALNRIERGARKAGRTLSDIDIGSSLEIKVVRDEMQRKKAIEDRKYGLTFVIPDTPIEQLEGRVTAEEQIRIATALRTGGVPAALPLITDEIVNRFVDIGTPDEVIVKAKGRMTKGANFYWVSMPPGPDPQFAFKALAEEVLPALGAGD
jgi:5,10-methylenetetrahydromethanopterin reductase